MTPTIRYDDSIVNGIPLLPSDRRWLVENHPQGVQVFATKEQAEAYVQEATDDPVVAPQSTGAHPDPTAGDSPSI